MLQEQSTLPLFVVMLGSVCLGGVVERWMLSGQKIWQSWPTPKSLKARFCAKGSAKLESLLQTYKPRVCVLACAYLETDGLPADCDLKRGLTGHGNTRPGRRGLFSFSLFFFFFFFFFFLSGGGRIGDSSAKPKQKRKKLKKEKKKNQQQTKWCIRRHSSSKKMTWTWTGGLSVTVGCPVQPYYHR